MNSLANSQRDVNVVSPAVEHAFADPCLPPLPAAFR